MALEQERKVYRFLMGYGDMLLGALEPKDAFAPMCDGGVHPAWALGHLAIVGHNMGKRFGGAGLWDDAEAERWKKLFAGGSRVTAGPEAYPAFDEIVAAWKRGHGVFDAAAASASPEVLAQPNPVERLRGGGLPTLGDLASFLLTAHEAMHVSQVSTWRRTRGMPPLF